MSGTAKATPDPSTERTTSIERTPSSSACFRSPLMSNPEVPVALAVTTRLAEPADVDFAFQVTEAAMRSYVEQTWGEWKADWQREHHAASFKTEPHQLVLVGETRAGILVVSEAATHLQLEKLYLLPEFQNHGVGTALLERLLQLGRAASKPVCLRVLTVNTSAQRFYARHGFRIAEFSAVRCVMAAGT